MPSALASRARELSEKLGLTQAEVAGIVGTSTRSVSRWWSGDANPQRSSQQRLRELTYVAEAISEVLEPEHAKLWLYMPNKRLDHHSPVDCVHEGDFRRVLGLIEALADGVVM